MKSDRACDRALVSTMATLPGQPSAANRGPVVAPPARVGKAAITLDLSNAIPHQPGVRQVRSWRTDADRHRSAAGSCHRRDREDFPEVRPRRLRSDIGHCRHPAHPELAASLAGTDLSIKGLTAPPTFMKRRCGRCRWHNLYNEPG